MADDLPGLGRLEALTDTPLAELPPVEAIRSRGERRRARHRSLVAGAALGVVLMGAGTALALTQATGDGQETLVPAAPVRSSATPSPSVSLSSVPLPTPTELPSPAASTAPSSSVVAPTAASPSPSAPGAARPAGPIPAKALLIATQLGESWVRWTSSRGPVEPALDPCGTGVPDGGAVVAHLSGQYQMQDQDGVLPESPGFYQHVVRYASPEAARAAAAEVRAAVSRCPRTTNEGSTATRTVVGTAPFLVELGYEQEGVDPPWVDYAGVAVSGDLVTTWVLGDPHGVPRNGGDQVAQLVTKALCGASGGC